jgi:DNA primase small subunit
MLRSYYKHLFPSKYYFWWLNYGVIPSSKFQKREFSFTLQNGIYARYKFFQNVQAFNTELIRLCPEKIDIGAIYNTEASKLVSCDDILIDDSIRLKIEPIDNRM